MLKTMFDGNIKLCSSASNMITAWWLNECNMFDSAMLDDVTLTCSVDPLTFGQALTARNVIVDESKKNSTLRSPHTVSVSLVPSSWLFFKDIL